MTFPTVIETPLPLEPVTRDPFGDVSPVAGETSAPMPAALPGRLPARGTQSA